MVGLKGGRGGECLGYPPTSSFDFASCKAARAGASSELSSRTVESSSSGKELRKANSTRAWPMAPAVLRPDVAAMVKMFVCTSASGLAPSGGDNQDSFPMDKVEDYLGNQGRLKEIRAR